jgi:hypothetical protein
MMSKVGKIASLTFASALLSSAQTTSPAGAPARMVVTLGHFYGQEPHLLTPGQLIVTHSTSSQYEPLKITNLVPLRGDRAGLELFVLVSNCSNCELGSKFEELRRFISSLPSTTAVGVAHIQDGRLEVAENPTPNRERAVSALSSSEESKPSNPFGALTELIQSWKQGSSRRAVLMFSSGVDPAAEDEVEDPSVEAAIEAAQRASVTVYAIYHPRADYLTRDYSKIHSGQVQLAHVADETGGEAYFLSFLPLPSWAPFLADIAEHLANQYLLEFLASPGEGPGALQEVTVKSKIPDIELMAPYRIWVAGRRSGSMGTNDQDSKVSRGKRP